MSKKNTEDRIADVINANPSISLDDLFAKLLPGAKEHSSDIVGTWDSDNQENPIVCIPKYAAVGDGKKFDKSKPSLLIFAELVHPCKVRVKDTKETVIAKKGSLVGIWAKPGMKDMRDFCGKTILMVRDPSKDKDIDKGNDLKGYRVGSNEAPGQRIPILTDRRFESKGVRTFLDPEGYGKPPTGASATEGTGGRIPF